MTAFIVRESSMLGRQGEPVTIGIPLPKAYLKEGESLTLVEGHGTVIPLQTTMSAYWPDRSVKWALLDFQVNLRAGEEKSYRVAVQAGKCEPSEDMRIVEKNGEFLVDSGTTSFFVQRDIFRPFSRVVRGQADLIEGVDSRTSVVDGKGLEYEAHIYRIMTEIPGHLRTVLKAEGGLLRGRRELARFISRLHFYCGKSFVRIELTLHNAKPARHPKGLWDLGDRGSVYFKDVSLELALGPNESKGIWYRLEKGKEMERVNSSSISVYQDSSGGSNWRSSNHANRFGKVPLSFQGYDATCDGRVIASGLRAEPIVYIGDGRNGISGTILKFWENFPKALSADSRGLHIAIFPETSAGLHELQGGEKKTHTFFLDFDGRPDALIWTHDPLVPALSPQWCIESRAIPYLVGDSGYLNQFHTKIVESVVEGEKSFFLRREVIDEYGWRHFGDVYADHEAIGHPEGMPLVSHYNNQYDLIFSFFRQFIRTGDEPWFSLMDDLARHVVDIDIYDTTRDREEYNKGMFWHTNHYIDAATSTHRSISKEHLRVPDPRYGGGGPGLEHNYATGLMFQYFLTGNTLSKETVLDLADWAMANTSGPNTILGVLYGLKGLIGTFKRIISGEKIQIREYPMTRGSGNSMSTLLDAFSLTHDTKYLRRVEKIIRGCVSPWDEIDSRDLLNAEPNWSYTVLLQAIGKYLDAKAELGETDEMYCYARDSLLHYARWMLKHEYPYLERPEILEYPNETWPAQDLKKSSVFFTAAKYADARAKEAFRMKGRFFYEHSLKELEELGTWHLTRPAALVLQNGDMCAHFLRSPDEDAPEVSCEYEVGKAGEYLTCISLMGRAFGSVGHALSRTSLSKEVRWLRSRLKQRW